VDPAGKGIPGVQVEMTLDGAKPKKYTLTTDKKGGYIRVGVGDGTCRMTFTHEWVSSMSGRRTWQVRRRRTA
jgi:hypothetical protein